ncbi:hypothetical protein AOZ06_41645 [Kibdelosporangium phytohabitans]|uniref:Uncharacterized protein n=1 Tax=Kibdelosporangium phytohabitans TaxID=860235 RepID=A0A0N9IBH5_9PSEU|nr:hypothetical protein AOZ06_41645 [Kibdelosporangium phytohabitans]
MGGDAVFEVVGGVVHAWVGDIECGSIGDRGEPSGAESSRTQSSDGYPARIVSFPGNDLAEITSYVWLLWQCALVK